MLLNKHKYLQDPLVIDFCAFISQSIDQFSYKEHSYRHRKTHEEFSFSGLADAANKYVWNDEGLKDTLTRMDDLRRRLVPLIKEDQEHEAGAERELFGICLEIIEWGKVSGFALDIGKRFVSGDLLRTIRYAGEALGSDRGEVRIDDWGYAVEKLPMDSGYTKIYSIASDSHVIYDSRVALALSGLVRAWNRKCADDEERRRCKKLLAFRIPNPQQTENRSERKPPRCKDACPSEFPWISVDRDKKHGETALWNIRANWILDRALKDYSVSMNHNGYVTLASQEGSDGKIDGHELAEKRWKRLRVIEMALFMMGYNIKSALV